MLLLLGCPPPTGGCFFNFAACLFALMAATSSMPEIAARYDLYVQLEATLVLGRIAQQRLGLVIQIVVLGIKFG